MRCCLDSTTFVAAKASQAIEAVNSSVREGWMKQKPGASASKVRQKHLAAMVWCKM